MPKRALPPIPFTSGLIRLLRESDLPLTREWRNRDDIRIRFRTTTLIGEEQHRAWFQSYSLKDNDYTFVIEVDGLPVGQIAIYAIDSERRTAEIGRIMLGNPNYAGKGIATSAMVALIKQAPEWFALDSIYLEVKEDNSRAIELYQRCGFERTSTNDGFVSMTFYYSSQNDLSDLERVA